MSAYAANVSSHPSVGSVEIIFQEPFKEFGVPVNPLVYSHKGPSLWSRLAPEEEQQVARNDDGLRVLGFPSAKVITLEHLAGLRRFNLDCGPVPSVKQ